MYDFMFEFRLKGVFDVVIFSVDYFLWGFMPFANVRPCPVNPEIREGGVKPRPCLGSQIIFNVAVRWGEFGRCRSNANFAINECRGKLV